ncbi:glutamate ABC transporter substrate-binding protein [Salinifilum aidingensis]
MLTQLNRTPRGSGSARRFRCAAAFAAVLALALTACGNPENRLAQGTENRPDVQVVHDPGFAPGTTMARLHDQGSIRVGVKFDQPLFGLQTAEGAIGFDVEIARIIAGRLGISPDDITWVEAPSKTREEIIEQGKVDMVVATYTINDERRERISFAGPYYEAGQDLMVRAGNTSITGPESLRETGAKVCSVTGSTPSEEIREYVDDDQLVLFDVYSKCADALRTGQVQAVTTDNVILMGLVAESGGKFELVRNTFTSEPYGIGIHRGDRRFCEFINRSLADAARDGTYRQAWAATAGAVAPETPRLPEPDPCT